MLGSMLRYVVPTVCNISTVGADHQALGVNNLCELGEPSVGHEVQAKEELGGEVLGAQLATIADDGGWGLGLGGLGREGWWQGGVVIAAVWRQEQFDK